MLDITNVYIDEGRNAVCLHLPYGRKMVENYNKLQKKLPDIFARVLQLFSYI